MALDNKPDGGFFFRHSDYWMLTRLLNILVLSVALTC